MKRILLILGIPLLLFSACKQSTSTKTEQNEDAFSFAFLTDIHLQPERGAEAGFMWAINEVNKRNPDFVLTGGDLVMDALNQTYGRADSLFNLYMELSGKFNMPGNLVGSNCNRFWSC